MLTSRERAQEQESIQDECVRRTHAPLNFKEHGAPVSLLVLGVDAVDVDVVVAVGIDVVDIVVVEPLS
jgi:hypothetical protein